MIGGGIVRGTGGKGRRGTWREGLTNKVEELQRGLDGRDVRRGTTDNGVDQLHRTSFCASKHKLHSYKPAISMDSGFW